MNTKHLLLCLAAGLALASCSSEPSDWRPDKKVSLDVVAPGTRSSDNFDQPAQEAAHHEAVEAKSESKEPHMIVDGTENPSAEKAMSADAEKVERTKKVEDSPKPAEASDSPIGE